MIVYELIAVLYCCLGIQVTYANLDFDERASKVSADLSVAVVDPGEQTSAAVEAYEEEQRRIEEEKNRWKGPVLSRSRGAIQGPSGKETYYNLNMSGVVAIMRGMGYTGEYWVRDDGCKMLGDYIMCAANLNIRPRGSIVETSLGQAIVCDTGGFARRNPYQIDIATTW